MNGREWLSSLKPYEGADNKRSSIQLAVTLILYILLITIMFLLVQKDYTYYAVLLLSLPAAGLYTRIFIIMHDCCHGSFYTTSRACAIAGTVCGIITLTPYYDWQRSHGIHHASVANLDKRGTGDVWTMTVEEYKSSPLRVKLQYRLFRNPLFLFTIAPPFLFLIIYRLPHSNMRRKDLASILLTDIVIVLEFAAAYYTTGITTYVRVFLPVVVIATISGMWLFYVQHQFKKVYWSHSESWDSIKAAMEGSSFYKLPAMLRWFSGSIGYHHIHHLKPRIPNYRLKQCYNEVPEVREITPITLRTSLRSLFLALWDEKSREMVRFSYLK